MGRWWRWAIITIIGEALLGIAVQDGVLWIRQRVSPVLAILIALVAVPVIHVLRRAGRANSRV